MQEEQTTRRRFIVAALAFSGVAAPLGSTWLKSAAAWAADDDAGLDELGRMAQLLFPHEGLDDRVYGGIMSTVMETTTDDQATQAMLDAAANTLDAARETSWLDLGAEEQFAVLQELQDQPFFAGIRETVRFHLYYHPDLWKHIDYPGSSKEFGGYIRRGFNDIAWLPEDE
ncbi:MAG: hypothetical protein GTO71_11440 [Woeseiaceae bacterium]|nr:hypothetical protein [Woeseiaceae bacterium]NIP21679.1 hypothetical protein [Woeseiaceae bacterium]NIS90765.1 hypothetical protein [Woeseiaceae bacterium]